jgi:peptidoglycan/xylan/chitin deacetylase (PgdA/CDA1 family)
MEPTLLIGYDVESNDPKVLEDFLLKASRIHEELDAPCTLFVLGRSLEMAPDIFVRVAAGSGMFDIQQHTYSHLPLKSVVIESDNGVTMFCRGGSLDEIREEVGKTKKLISELLGLECIGLTGPNGYYRGLMDRPDILEVLHELGIRFTRTYARNEKDWQPVPFEVQPFFYEPQGFPDMMEFPVQGWQDCIWREIHGWEKVDLYLEMLFEGLEFVASRGLTWCYCGHDWSSIKGDPDMRIMREFIRRAKEMGFRLTSYRGYFEEASRSRDR